MAPFCLPTLRTPLLTIPANSTISRGESWSSSTCIPRAFSWDRSSSEAPASGQRRPRAGAKLGPLLEDAPRHRCAAEGVLPGGSVGGPLDGGSPHGSERVREASPPDCEVDCSESRRRSEIRCVALRDEKGGRGPQLRLARSR